MYMQIYYPTNATYHYNKGYHHSLGRKNYTLCNLCKKHDFYTSWTASMVQLMFQLSETRLYAFHTCYMSNKSVENVWCYNIIVLKTSSIVQLFPLPWVVPFQKYIYTCPWLPFTPPIMNSECVNTMYENTNVVFFVCTIKWLHFLLHISSAIYARSWKRWWQKQDVWGSKMWRSLAWNPWQSK